MYNEADRIQDNLRNILEALDGLNITYEYILINDGSTDDSYEKAKQILKDLPTCRIIHYEKNRGRGYALRQGIYNARGRYIITTESDLSWGAEIIEKLYRALLNTGSDVVVASVYMPGGRLENVPSFRHLLSRYGNKFMRWSFGGKLTMLSGMTRGYRRETVQSLYLEEDNKEIHLEIIAKAQARNFTITEIPVCYQVGISECWQTQKSRFWHITICNSTFVCFLQAGCSAHVFLGCSKYRDHWLFPYNIWYYQQTFSHYIPTSSLSAHLWFGLHCHINAFFAFWYSEQSNNVCLSQHGTYPVPNL